ncbi:hypothetical protein AMTR_s00070p00032140 [Amborella trichopoda]|uniref:Uncharacterized protein n=1 Tax=Amborella trichopoda TaxID=13333 RepID=U5D4Q2_AMBTC|nr:hypothetical protein AMTR_s00070p00032140 [Amborella trichopoda]
MHDNSCSVDFEELLRYQAYGKVRDMINAVNKVHDGPKYQIMEVFTSYDERRERAGGGWGFGRAQLWEGLKGCKRKGNHSSLPPHQDNDMLPFKMMLFVLEH